MSIYKIQPLVESGFDFSTIFPEKQKTLQEFGGFNFGIQDIVNLLATQTDNFTKKNEVALDVDKYIYEAYEKQRALNEPETPKEEPKPQKSKTEQQIEKLENGIKGVKLAMKVIKNEKDKKFASEKLDSYEKFLKKLQSKKGQGGELIIETQHSFGDPKENTDPKIDLSFSAQDPKKEDGGILESVKLRNIQSGKVSDWDLSEVIESINQSGEGSGVVYDEKNWLDGFDNISENYSLLDESGNALNEFANYSKGGGVYEGISTKDKFVVDQLLHVISLKSISEKKNTIENSILPNIEDYNLDEMTKKITKDNLKYALRQKNVSSLNKVLTTSINALRSNEMSKGGDIDDLLLQEIRLENELRGYKADYEDALGKRKEELKDVIEDVEEELADVRRKLNINASMVSGKKNFGKSGIVEVKPIHASREDVAELENWLNENDWEFGRATTGLSRSRNELPYFQIDTSNASEDNLLSLHNYLERKHWNWVNLYAKGGGFEKLAKQVAKEYEGHKVAPEYQKEYGKKYSHEEAVEVGKKVAAKVYREQLANK